MTIAELIARLQVFNDQLSVFSTFDSGFGVRSVDCVWLAKTGNIILAEAGEVMGPEAIRPEWAPSKQIEELWEARNQDDVV